MADCLFVRLEDVQYHREFMARMFAIINHLFVLLYNL